MPWEIIRNEVGVEWDLQIKKNRKIPGFKGNINWGEGKNSNKRNATEKASMSLSRAREQSILVEEKCETNQCQI